MKGKISIVAGEFHREHTNKMVAAAESRAKELELVIATIEWVPGAFEMPLAVKRQIESLNPDGCVVLGVIEKGETKRGLVLAHGLVSALIDMQLKYMKPIGFGIVGPDIMPSQMPPRLEPYAAGAVSAVSKMLR